MGGHLRAGETLPQAIREAEEEIGLDVALTDLTRLGRRFAHGMAGKDNEVQEVFALRSDLPLGAYRLHAAEVDAVVSVPVTAALALFEGRQAVVDGKQLRRGSNTPSAIRVAVSGFAAGEAGSGYAVRALRGLLEVVIGGSPQPFELR